MRAAALAQISRFDIPCIPRWGWCAVGVVNVHVMWPTLLARPTPEPTNVLLRLQGGLWNAEALTDVCNVHVYRGEVPSQLLRAQFARWSLLPAQQATAPGGPLRPIVWAVLWCRCGLATA